MKVFEKINPAIKTTPLMILLTMLVPQVLLALFRAHNLYLIREAITEHRALILLNYLGIPLLLAGLALAMLLWSRRVRRDVPRLPMLGFFLLQTAGLVCFLLSMEHLIPDGVDEWIVPVGSFMMVQLASAMPGLFFGFICIANVRWFGSILINVGSSFALFLGVPVFLFIIGNAFPLWRAPEMFVITVFVAGTLVCAFAFLQLLLWLSGRMRGGWIAMLLFAVIFPVGGLALNHRIPFPADLQHWGFYALTIANGLVLLWGCHPSAKNSTVCAAITAFSYPFTCYFFFLFLPFLPFSILAMIAVGTGFLILTPTLLFILHTRRIALQFQDLKARFSPTQIMAGFLSAFLLVPAAYVGRALHHKQVFAQTLERIYAAPLDDPGPMPSPRVAAYALRKLRDSKNGVYVPILSETYNRIVFGGMVLPDGKIEELEQLLLGETSGERRERDEVSFYSMVTGDDRRTAGRNVRPPGRNVSLVNTECSGETDRCETEATVLITMRNNTERQSEFVADITIPEGVFVSGYELKIGDEMVPARLSDRKAAMWVYHMIRDRARRDPGLLVYTGPNRLRLNVFPFAGNEERQCALKLLYPAGMAPEINIGGTSVVLPGGQSATTLVATAAGRQAVCIPAEQAQQGGGVFRTVERIALAGSDETPGYCPEWDVKRKLLDYWNSGDEQLNTVLWFVTESEQPLVSLDGAAYWLSLIPDGGWGGDAPDRMEVIPFQCGKQVRVVPKQTGGMVVFDSTEPIENLVAGARLDAGSRYAKAVDVWQGWWQTQLHPEQEEAQRKEILLAAREINILIPSAAFLAVESAAQQKALKEAERKSLNSHATLAFDEFEEEPLDSPEPGMLFPMLILLPLFHWLHGRRVCRA